jgi:hypothetical protein
MWYIYAADKLWAKLQSEEQTGLNREAWGRYKQGLSDSQVRWRNQTTKKLIENALSEIKRVEDGKMA